MLRGTVIGESLRPGARIEDVPLRVTCIRRGGPAELSAAQIAAGVPKRWTLIEFEADEADADKLATSIASALDDTGWYVDFHSTTDSYVIFSGRTFRYARGDARGRAAAIEFGRSRGVPDSQLDWPT
jgi:hypothetical protein